MPSKNATIAVLLSVAMVMFAGCAGWGTDGPADPDEKTDDNGEAQADEGADAVEGDDAVEDTSSTSEGNTGSQDGSEPSDGSTQSDSDSGDASSSKGEGTNYPYDSGSDEGTDETGDDDSQSDDPDISDGSDKSDNMNDSAKSEAHTLTITVKNPDGEPATDADVSVVTYDGGSPVDTGTTDENGQMTLDVEDGDYEVSVSPESGAQSSDNRLVRINGEDNELVVQLEDPGEPTADMRVHAEDAETGEYVEGVAITVENRETGETYTGTTSQGDEYDGVYHNFEDLPVGTYQVTAESNGYETATDVVELTGSGRQPILHLNPVDAEFTVTGVDRFGEPVTEAHVSFTHDEYGVTDVQLNENGEATFQVPVHGTWSYSVTAPGYETEGVGEQVEVTGDVDREVQVENEVHELVVNVGDEAPVENADITLERHADGATTTEQTDEDGRVTFDVYTGDYTVTGVDERGEEQSIEVRVPDNQSIHLDEMYETTNVPFSVEILGGEPAPDVEVNGETQLKEGEHTFSTSPTDENGNTQAELLVGQRYYIEVTGPSGDYQVIGASEDGNDRSNEFVVEDDTSITIRTNPSQTPPGAAEAA